jgi:hypothetical protein
MLLPTGAAASTIAYNCGTCGAHNVSWDVTYAVVNGALHQYTLNLTATYDPTGAGAPNGWDFTNINAVAFKISGAGYDATPTVVGPAEDTWTLLGGGLDAGGCNGSGAGFFCANSAGLGATHNATPGTTTTDTWIFQLDLTSALSGTSVPGTLKAQFTDAFGAKVGSLVSEDATFTAACTVNCTVNQQDVPVPEPSALVLVGGGFLVAATTARRRRHNKG